MAEMSTVAHPYALALFNLAKQQGDEKMWLDVLATLENLVADVQFNELLNNPKIDSNQIIEIVQASLKDRAYKDVLNLVRLLLENNRILAIHEIRNIFRTLVLEEQKCGDAIIESAYEMGGEEVQDFEQLLSKKFGIKITAKVKVNSELIGGIKITVNDKVIDGSVKGRLENLATELRN